MIRITNYGFEIDDSIKSLTGTNPFIHRFAFYFTFRGVCDRSLAGQEGVSKDLDVMRMGASDQLFQTTDNLLRANRLVRKVIGCGMFDVIRTLRENHKFYAGYTQHISIKPR